MSKGKDRALRREVEHSFDDEGIGNIGSCFRGTEGQGAGKVLFNNSGNMIGSGLQDGCSRALLPFAETLFCKGFVPIKFFLDASLEVGNLFMEFVGSGLLQVFEGLAQFLHGFNPRGWLASEL